MNLNVLLWPIALVFIWTPSAVLFNSSIKNRLRNPARRKDEGLASLLRSPVNWIDLLRGGFGGWILQHQVLSYRSGQDDLGVVFTVFLFAVLVIGVLAQTVWLDRPIRVIGPTFFITGLTLALCGPSVGGFGLLIGITCALMMRRLSLGFILVPVGLVGFSILFHKFSMLVAFNAAVFALPALLSFGLGVRLSYVRKLAPHHSRGSGSNSSKTDERGAASSRAGLAAAALSSNYKAAEPAQGSAATAQSSMLGLDLPRIVREKRSA